MCIQKWESLNKLPKVTTSRLIGKYLLIGIAKSKLASFAEFSRSIECSVEIIVSLDSEVRYAKWVEMNVSEFRRNQLSIIWDLYWLNALNYLRDAVKILALRGPRISSRPSPIVFFSIISEKYVWSSWNFDCVRNFERALFWNHAKDVLKIHSWKRCLIDLRAVSKHTHIDNRLQLINGTSFVCLLAWKLSKPAHWLSHSRSSTRNYWQRTDFFRLDLLIPFSSSLANGHPLISFSHWCSSFVRYLGQLINSFDAFFRIPDFINVSTYQKNHTL